MYACPDEMKCQFATYPSDDSAVDGEALAVDLVVEQQRVDADDREEQQQRGHEAARPPRPERPERDRVASRSTR